LHVASQVKPPL